MRSADSEYDPRRWHESSLQRRPRRRLTRWALLGGLACVAATPIIDLANPGGVFAPTYMLLVVAATMSPFARESFLTGKGFAIYDEFEQHALLVSLRRAYLIVLALLAALFVWLALGSRLGWMVPTSSHQWMTLGGAALIWMAAMPVTVAEWTVPFPDAEDQPL